MDLIVLFDIIHEPHYIISVNFYFYLSYFQKENSKKIQSDTVLSILNGISKHGPDS